MDGQRWSRRLRRYPPEAHSLPDSRSRKKSDSTSALGTFDGLGRPSPPRAHSDRVLEASEEELGIQEDVASQEKTDRVRPDNSESPGTPYDDGEYEYSELFDGEYEPELHEPIDDRPVSYFNSFHLFLSDKSLVS